VATNLTINGVAYSYPEDGDAAGWGTDATNWAAAVSSSLLQKTGGTFTLSANVDFGNSYGLLSSHFSSRTSAVAATGIVRLAKTDNISYRNNADSGDLTLGIGTDDLLEFNSVDLADVSTAQTLTNKTLTTPLGILTSDVLHANISGATYTSAQQVEDVTNSTGCISGAGFTDDTDGTITIAAGTGFIRATDSDVAEILSFNWSAESGTNVDLVDGDLNYIYVEYNAGTPRLVATTTIRTDFNTNIFLGNVYRDGTVLHMTPENRIHINDSASRLIQRLQSIEPFARASGAIISETGTRNIALTAGSFYQALEPFTSSAIDTSVTDSFTYYYSDGAGGWTTQTTQTQINNTQYDDGSGTLATLVTNRYGVHWVFIGVDGDVYVVYGLDSYLLADATDATVPASLPPHFEDHAFIVGKIVVLKNSSSFTTIESAFEISFTGTTATDHGDLIGLSDDDHTQYLLVDGTRAMTGTLQMGANNITTTGTVDGRDVATDGSTQDTHIADATKHRIINDAGTSLTELWSASKISTEIASGGLTGLSDLATGVVLTLSDADIYMSVDLGVGTATPEGTLHVKKSDYATSSTPSTGADGLVIEDATETGITIASATAGSLRFADAASNSAGIIEYNHTSDYMRFFTGAAEALRINAAGEVGIGETVPLGKLHVKTGDSGATSVSSAANELVIEGDGISNVGLTFLNTGGNSQFIMFGDDVDNGIGRLSYNHADDSMRFQTNGSEYMRIDSAGNVGIGNNAPDASLNIESYSGSGASVGFRFNNGVQYMSRTGTTSQSAMAFVNANGQVGTITTSGTSTAYNTSSDYRLKENITEITDGIDRFKLLKAVQFNFKADTTKTVDGFIAHEVQAIIPEAVYGEKDAVDEDNKPIHQGIDQSKIVPLMAAALKEAIAKIEALEARLNTLEGGS